MDALEFRRMAKLLTHSRLRDAQFWLDQVTASVFSGTYADPKAGQITFADLYGEWSARQDNDFEPATLIELFERGSFRE